MILKVTRLGHPVLREVTQRVAPEELANPLFQRFLDDMAETMREYSGVGLAANQVHVPKRLAVIEVDLPQSKKRKARRVPMTVLVNPEVVERSKELVYDWEGCLSVPELRGSVPRHRFVRVKALDRHGKPLEFRAEDFYARVVQHECDHLDGKVYLDRMSDLRTLTHLTEYARYWAG